MHIFFYSLINCKKNYILSKDLNCIDNKNKFINIKFKRTKNNQKFNFHLLRFPISCSYLISLKKSIP